MYLKDKEVLSTKKFKVHCEKPLEEEEGGFHMI